MGLLLIVGGIFETGLTSRIVQGLDRGDTAIPISPDRRAVPQRMMTGEIGLVQGQGIKTVKREVATGSAYQEVDGLLKQLGAGPTVDEVRMGLRTNLTPSTRLSMVKLSGGTAWIDIDDQDTQSGFTSENASLAVGQIACTVTSLAQIDNVRLERQGVKVDVPTGDGILTDRPVKCSDYPRFVD